MRNDVRLLGQAKHVQDQGDFPIPHDCRAGKDADALQLFAQRFDDDFLGIIDLVDDQPELAVAAPQHNDVRRFLCVRSGGLGSFNLQFPVQVDQGEQIAAQAVERRPVDQLDGRVAVIQSNQFQQADLRDRETVLRRWSRPARG